MGLQITVDFSVHVLDFHFFAIEHQKDRVKRETLDISNNYSASVYELHFHIALKTLLSQHTPAYFEKINKMVQ
jgi:hypothetical protein